MRGALSRLADLGDNEFTLSGVSYVDEVACLSIDTLNGQPSRRNAALSHEIGHLVVGERRHCRGYWDLDTLTSYPCPDRQQAPHGFCPSCQSRTGFNPAFYNAPASALSSQQRRYNAKPHAVYLAGFAADVIKVGISHLDRLRSRWLEQGARAGLVLTVADNAYDARAVEAAAVGRMGLVERLSTAKKITLLRRPLHVEALEERLLSTCDHLCRTLRVQREDWPTIWMDDVYFPEGTPDFARLAEADAKLSQVGGRWHGLIGSIACFESGEGPVAQDLAPMFGRQIAYRTGPTTLRVDVKPHQARLL